MAESFDTEVADAIHEACVSHDVLGWSGDKMNVVDAIAKLARSVTNLGNADAATPMGAVEAHGVAVREAGEAIAASLDGVAAAIERLAESVERSTT